MSRNKNVRDSDGNTLHENHIYFVNNQGELINYGTFTCKMRKSDAEAEQMAQDFPAYWKKLPEHWQAIDTYRVDDLFPLPSSRLYHTRKKLLVPGCRTGGKTVYQDLKEAHRTLGAWLAEQPEHKA